MLVFVLVGPWAGAEHWLWALATTMRWGIMAQTADVTTVALIEPLHGLTFALFHLGSCIIADTVPSSLAGLAQAFYGTVGIGGATDLLTILSGCGPAGFWGMTLLCCAAFPIIWRCTSRFHKISTARRPHHPDRNQLDYST